MILIVDAIQPRARVVVLGTCKKAIVYTVIHFTASYTFIFRYKPVLQAVSVALLNLNLHTLSNMCRV